MLDFVTIDVIIHRKIFEYLLSFITFNHDHLNICLDLKNQKCSKFNAVQHELEKARTVWLPIIVRFFFHKHSKVGNDKFMLYLFQKSEQRQEYTEILSHFTGLSILEHFIFNSIDNSTLATCSYRFLFFLTFCTD